MVTDSGVSDPLLLRRVLGGPDLGGLIDRIRVRVDGGEPVDGTVTLVGATPEQRQAAARLLGRAIGRGTSLSVPLPEVEATLREAGIAPGLSAAVEVLAGPVRDRAAERAAEIRLFQNALAAARRSRLAGAPWYQAWLDQISRDGTLTRLLRRGQGHLLAQVTAVLERLPAGADEPAVLLPVLAEMVTGDSRALAGTPLAVLALVALAVREDIPAPSGRQEKRMLWASAGVVTDEPAPQPCRWPSTCMCARTRQCCARRRISSARTARRLSAPRASRRWPATGSCRPLWRPERGFTGTATSTGRGCG